MRTPDMARQHRLAFGTIFATVVPAVPAAVLLWALAFKAATGWSRNTVEGLEAAVLVLGIFPAIGLGGAVGAVCWLRLIRRRVTGDVAWYWLTRGTPPFRIAHRINTYVFTLGWGGPPPDAS